MPPVQWIPGVLSRPGRDGDLSPHLMRKLRMSRSYTSPPPLAPAWRVEGQLYFTFTFILQVEKVVRLKLASHVARVLETFDRCKLRYLIVIRCDKALV
jgi:hypothetical protein